VKLEELSNNSFERKNVSFLGRGKHTLTPPKYIQGVKTPNPQDILPWLNLTAKCSTTERMASVEWSQLIHRTPTADSECAKRAKHWIRIAGRRLPRDVASILLLKS